MSVELPESSNWVSLSDPLLPVSPEESEDKHKMVTINAAISIFLQIREVFILRLSLLVSLGQPSLSSPFSPLSLFALPDSLSSSFVLSGPYQQQEMSLFSLPPPTSKLCVNTALFVPSCQRGRLSPCSQVCVTRQFFFFFF